MGYSLSVEGFLDYILNYARLGHENTGTFHNFGGEGWLALLRAHTSTVFVHPYGAVALYQILAGLAAVLILVSSFRRKRDVLENTLLIWYLTYAIFIMWWLPSEYEFYLTHLWILVLLGAKGANSSLRVFRYRLRLGWYLGLVGVVALALNVPHMISAPHKTWEPRERADRVAEAFPEETILLTNYFEAEFLRYYHPHVSLKADQVIREFAQGKGGQWTQYRSRPKALPLEFLNPGFIPRNYPEPLSPAQWYACFAWFQNQTPTDSVGVTCLDVSIVAVGDQSFAVFRGPTRFFESDTAAFRETGSRIENHAPEISTYLRQFPSP